MLDAKTDSASSLEFYHQKPDWTLEYFLQVLLDDNKPLVEFPYRNYDKYCSSIASIGSLYDQMNALGKIPIVSFLDFLDSLKFIL